MKKGIIAITLLLTGALFVSPITTNANSIKNDIDQVKVEEQQNTEKVEVKTEVKDETVEKEEVKVNEENTYKPEVNNNQSSKVETTTDKKEEVLNKKEEVSNKKDEVEKEEVSEEENKTDEIVQSNGMSKSEAESVLNNYLNSTEQGDMTYAYQGDENTFEVIKEKGIRGYVFLPNVETDMAYLVDKDSGNIYYFHPSGYFELV